MAPTEFGYAQRMSRLVFAILIVCMPVLAGAVEAPKCGTSAWKSAEAATLTYCRGHKAVAAGCRLVNQALSDCAHPPEAFVGHLGELEVLFVLVPVAKTAKVWRVGLKEVGNRFRVVRFSLDELDTHIPDEF
jgi:hypothetical protein